MSNFDKGPVGSLDTTPPALSRYLHLRTHAHKALTAAPSSIRHGDATSSGNKKRPHPWNRDSADMPQRLGYVAVDRQDRYHHWIEQVGYLSPLDGEWPSWQARQRASDQSRRHIVLCVFGLESQCRHARTMPLRDHMDTSGVIQRWLNLSKIKYDAGKTHGIGKTHGTL
jgi:hypothetical protein